MPYQIQAEINIVEVYIVQNLSESGPYSWMEIYVALRKGECSYSDAIRINGDSEIKSIDEFGFWNEGADVGPLTSDEILFLLREGFWDTPIRAKTEDEAEYSTPESPLAEKPRLTEQSDSTETQNNRIWF